MRLVRNLILISVPLILMCIYAYFMPMSYMTEEYPMWMEEKNYVNQNEKASPTTLIIGDSRAKSGVLPGELCPDGSAYNIAIGGATSIEMYYALRNYLKYHEAPDTALVIFAPFHFYEIDNWGQTLYYNYLTLPEIIEIEANAAMLRDKRVQYSGWLADILSFKLRLPNKYLDQIYISRFGRNGEKNREKYERIQREYGFTSFGEEEGNDGLAYEAHKKEFELSPMSDLYYLRLLDLLKSHGIRVFIIQAPLNKATDKVITEKFRSAYTAYMEGIAEKYPDFTVETKVPAYDNAFFGDNNHLNRRGAEKFTKEIGERYRGF